MKFRRKKGPVVTHEELPAKHSYMLSGVWKSGTMVFVCRNCPATIRVERATIYGLLVTGSDALKHISRPWPECPQEFPDGLMRVLPVRNYSHG